MDFDPLVCLPYTSEDQVHNLAFAPAICHIVYKYA